MRKLLKIFIDYFGIRAMMLFVSFLCFLIAGLIIYYMSGLGINLSFVFNAFLAALPLFISGTVVKISEVINKYLGAVIFIAWLLFLPNAFYCITDMKHLSFIYQSSEAVSTREYLIVWINLIYIAVLAFLGTIYGAYSMMIFHKLINRHFGNIKSHCIMIAISLLSGYGMYIGRFLRLNSWDFLNPLKLISTIGSNLNLFTLFSSIIFAMYIIFAYYILYFFIYKNSQDDPLLSWE